MTVNVTQIKLGILILIFWLPSDLQRITVFKFPPVLPICQSLLLYSLSLCYPPSCHTFFSLRSPHSDTIRPTTPRLTQWQVTDSVRRSSIQMSQYCQTDSNAALCWSYKWSYYHMNIWRWRKSGIFGILRRNFHIKAVINILFYGFWFMGKSPSSGFWLYKCTFPVSFLSACAWFIHTGFLSLRLNSVSR